MNSLQVPPGADRADFHGHGGAPYMPSTSIDVFAKARGHERAEQLRAAREADVLPYFRVLEGAGAAGRRDGGRRADHARLQQLPRADRRRARHAGRRATRCERYGTGLTGSRLLNGTIPLHLELEREIAEWMGTEDAIVFTTGHQANVGTLGHDPRARRHRRRRLRRPRLDPRRLPALAGQAAPLPPQPARQARARRSSARRATAAASSSSSTASSRWRATSRRCAEIGDLCERYGARLMVDEAHGAGVLGARGAGHRRAARRRGPRRPADGHLLQVAGLLRRLRRRARPRSSSTCAIQSRAFLFTASAVPAAVGAALAALRVVRSADGPAAAARGARQRPPPARRARRSAASRVVRSAAAAGCAPAARDVVTPIVPVAGRRRLEGRAAVARAVRRRRVRQHRAAPRRPARRRAAAHERDGDPRPRDARPRAGRLRDGQGGRSRPSTARSPAGRLRRAVLSALSQASRPRRKSALLATSSRRPPLTAPRVADVASPTRVAATHGERAPRGRSWERRPDAGFDPPLPRDRR